MQLTTLLTLTFVTATAVIAAPAEYGKDATPVHGADKPKHSTDKPKWIRGLGHLLGREAAPEPAPMAVPNPVANADFTPTLVQRSPASEKEKEKEPKEKKPKKDPPSYPPPPPGPSVDHVAWVRKRDPQSEGTELMGVQEQQIETRDANPELLKAREFTPVSEELLKRLAAPLPEPVAEALPEAFPEALPAAFPVAQPAPFPDAKPEPVLEAQPGPILI